MADEAKKNTNGDEPAAPEAAVSKSEDGTTPAPTTEKVKVEVEKAESKELTAVLTKVASLVEDIAKATGAKPAEEDVEKSGDPARVLLAKQLKGAGMKADDIKKALADYDAELAKVKKAETPAPAATAETTKAEAPKVEEQDEVAKMLEVLSQAVEKAKRFTPKREDALKGIIDQLQKLMSDMASIPAGASPKTSAPGGASFGASDVASLTKSIGDLVETVKASLASTAEVNKALAERVEKIEKTRAPSTSVENDGETDNKVEKNKSMWSGVL